MAEMANQGGYVSVDENTSEDGALRMSSDESQSDVGADNGCDLNEDGACGDGDESPNRRAHHSDLKKMRKKRLTASYGPLKKVVKKVWGYWKGVPNRRARYSNLEMRRKKRLTASHERLNKIVKMVGGDRKGVATFSRIKTLQIANSLLKEKFQEWAETRSNAKKLRAELLAALPTIDSEEREEVQKHIDELSKVAQNTIPLLPLPPELRASEYIKGGEESEEEVEHSRLITVANIDDLHEEQGAGAGRDHDLDEQADDEEGCATLDEYARDEDSDDTAPSPSGDSML